MEQIASNDTRSGANTLKPTIYWNQILYLLGFALFVDGDPSDNKLDVFLDVSIELRYVIDPQIKTERQALKDWYLLHQFELGVLATKLEDDFLPNLLQEISPHGHKIDIVTSIVQILIADHSYSYAAQSLTRKFILYWYMSAKDYDDINYICADLMVEKVNTLNERLKV